MGGTTGASGTKPDRNPAGCPGYPGTTGIMGSGIPGPGGTTCGEVIRAAPGVKMIGAGGMGPWLGGAGANSHTHVNY